MSDQKDPQNEFSEVDPRILEILENLGIDLNSIDPNALTIGELQDMIDKGAWPDGIVWSGDHGGPIDPE